MGRPTPSGAATLSMTLLTAAAAALGLPDWVWMLTGIAAVLLGFYSIAMWKPVREWLGLPEPDQDEPERIAFDLDDESELVTRRTKVSGHHRVSRLRGRSRHTDEDSEIE